MPDGAPLPVSGEIDVTNAYELAVAIDAYARANDGAVVLDCADLAYIDSRGIAAVVDAWRRLGRENRPLRLINLRSNVRLALDAQRVLHLFV